MKAQIRVGQIRYVQGSDNPKDWKGALLGKTRPHLIISITGNTALCAPLTHSEKQGTYNQIFKIMIDDVPNYIVLNQLRAVSEEEILTYKASVDANTLAIIKSKITSLLLTEGEKKNKQVITEETKKGLLQDYQFMPMKALQNKYHLSKRAIYSAIWGGGNTSACGTT